MTYWNNKKAEPANLRLFVPGEGWRAYSDKPSDGTTPLVAGSKRSVESALLNALNSTNLVVLTGSGSSFAAFNPPGEGGAVKPAAPSMSDLWKAVKSSVGDETFDAVCATFEDAKIETNIEKLLTLCKLYLELHETANDEASARIKKFVGDAEEAILRRVDVIDRNTNLDAHSALITKVGRRGVRKPRTRIFTTNYDLCFEEAARRHRFTVIDGFSHSLDQVYDAVHFSTDVVRRDPSKEAPDYVENVFHLYKLHGSMDWRRVGQEIVRSRGKEGAPVLIYPRSSKYQESYGAPYLDMIGALQAALREPDTALVISGFGFNDDHLSRPVLSAIETNMSLRVVLCDPAFLASADLQKNEHVIADTAPLTNPFLKAFNRLAESGDARVHLINGRFDDLAFALPDLIGETDRERHAARIRALRDAEVGAGG